VGEPRRTFGGASGSNNTSTVDGADNRDNRYGGPLMTFSTDALEQFQLSTSQFTAADGRTSGEFRVRILDQPVPARVGEDGEVERGREPGT